MHLYLRTTDFTTEVASIGLQDGCFPVIGSQRITTPNNEQIEPAIWFKVQVIDAVSIDCMRRAILWNSATVFNGELAQVCEGSSDSEQSESSSEKSGEHEPPPPEQANPDRLSRHSHDGRKAKLLRKSTNFSSSKRISESMYIGGECYGYQSDLDELFDTAQELMSDYAEERISSKDMHETIFRLLHCYILPAIRLTSDDLAKVIAAYKSQEDAVELMDNEILRKNHEIERLQSAQKTQREKHFISELCSGEAKKLCYHPDFAKALEKHIRADIDNSNDFLETLQIAVNQAKLDDDPQLSAKRKQRDEHHKLHERLLNAREVLHEFIQHHQHDSPNKRHSRLNLRSLKSRSKKNGRRNSPPELDPLQSVYLGIDQQIVQRLDELMALADKKVLVISVKEAIRMTIKELQSGGDTFGIDIDKTGRIKATDVLRHSNVPKSWQTLSEQVSSIISDPSQGLGHKHQTFCEILQKQCKSLDREKRLFYICESTRGTPGEDEEPLASTNVPVQDILDVSSDRNSKISSRSHSFSSRGSIQSSKNFKYSSSLGSLANPDALPDPSSVPQQSETEHHGIDTLPQSTKGIACFPLPLLRRLSKGSSSARDSNSSGSQRDSLVHVSNENTDQESTDTPDSYIIVHGSEQDFSRKMLTQLKDSIHRHLDYICTSLLSELGYTDQAHYRKIWLCYETLFYDELMPHLVELYETTFSSVSCGLQELLSFLTVDDLDIGGSIVAHMLRDDRSSLDTTLDSMLNTTLDSVGPDDGTASGDHLESQNLFSDTTATPTLEAISQPNMCCTLWHSQQMGEQKSDRPSAIPACRDVHDNGESGFDMPHKPLRQMSTPDPNVTPPTSPTISPPTSPTAIKLKTIKIHHPSMVTVLYDRRTWPLPQRVIPLTESIDCGVEALNIIDEEEGSWADSSTGGMPSPQSPSLGQKVITLKADFKQMFMVAFESLQGVVREKCPLLKLQHLTRCLREISQQVSVIHKQVGAEVQGACTDDLIDLLVVLLCNCDRELLGKIYPHIMLLADLMPPFFEGGPYSFSLVQFLVALEFLQDRLVMKRRSS